MPFPVELDGHTFSRPPDLAVWVFDGARAGGFPERALARAAREGRLSRDEAVGLCAALVQTADPPVVVCGARLAAAVGEPTLARLLAVAVEALDVGTLLSLADDGRSVEDHLLEAAAALLTEDDAARAALLPRLRHAGLGAAEVRVLATRATAAELRALLPAALLEGLPPGTADALAAGLDREDEVAEALLDALVALPPADRARVWAACARAGLHRRRPEVEARLVGPIPEP